MRVHSLRNLTLQMQEMVQVFRQQRCASPYGRRAELGIVVGIAAGIVVGIVVGIVADIVAGIVVVVVVFGHVGVKQALVGLDSQM